MLRLLPCTGGRPAEYGLWSCLIWAVNQLWRTKAIQVGRYTGQYTAGKWSAGGASDFASSDGGVSWAVQYDGATWSEPWLLCRRLGGLAVCVSCCSLYDCILWPAHNHLSPLPLKTGQDNPTTPNFNQITTYLKSTTHVSTLSKITDWILNRVKTIRTHMKMKTSMQIMFWSQPFWLVYEMRRFLFVYQRYDCRTSCRASIRLAYASFYQWIFPLYQ